MKKKINIYSIIIGIVLGALLGYFFGNVILTKIDNISIIILSMIIFIGLFGYLGYKMPITTELIGFVFSLFILFQSAWDGLVQDWNTMRTILTISSLALLILNSFTGRLRIGTAKKMSKKLAGI